jgi:hypothetical protein
MGGYRTHNNQHKQIIVSINDHYNQGQTQELNLGGEGGI